MVIGFIKDLMGDHAFVEMEKLKDQYMEAYKNLGAKYKRDKDKWEKNEEDLKENNKALENLKDKYMNDCKNMEETYKNFGAKYRRDLEMWEKNAKELREIHKMSYDKVMEEYERLEHAYNELNAKYNDKEKLVTKLGKSQAEYKELDTLRNEICDMTEEAKGKLMVKAVGVLETILQNDDRWSVEVWAHMAELKSKMSKDETSIPASKNANQSLEQDLKKLEENYSEDREMWKKEIKELEAKQKEDGEVWKLKKEMLELENEALRYKWKQDQETWEQERKSFLVAVEIGNKELTKLKLEETAYKDANESIQQDLNKLEQNYKEDREMWKKELEELKGNHEKDHELWKQREKMMELENEGLRSKWKQEQEMCEQERMRFLDTVMEKLKAEREKYIAVWEEEKRKVVTEAKEALLKKKLKYKEERRSWNHQRTNLVAEICAANKSAEIYRDLLHGYDELDMKNDTIGENFE